MLLRQVHESAAARDAVQPCVQICSGYGSCDPLEGACDCWTGHTGADCSVCEPGYYRGVTGQCLPDAPLPCFDTNGTSSHTDPGSYACDAALGMRAACHDRGNCTSLSQADGSGCECDEGFFGELCQLSICPQGWTDEQCACCPSGVLSGSGACCAMGDDGALPVLDRHGECCIDGLDVLGNCGGDCLNIDRYGNCCEVR